MQDMLNRTSRNPSAHTSCSCRFVFGIAAVDLIARADYSDAEEVHG